VAGTFQIQQENVFIKHLCPHCLFCEYLEWMWCNSWVPPACCHLFVVGGLSTSVTRIAMLAGVFILLLEPPKPDRLKD